MQRKAFGLLKILLSVVLGALAASMPSSDEIAEATAAYESSIHSMADQIEVLRAGIDDVRGSDYEALAEAAARLTQHASAVAAGATGDIETIRHLNTALAGVCEALEASLKAVDLESVQHSHETLLAIADFLDKKVVPAANEAAAAVRKTSAVLEDQGAALAEMIRDAPLGADAILRMGESLGDFSEAVSKADEFSREIKGKMPEIINGLRNAKQAVREAAAVAYWAPGISSKPLYKAGDAIGTTADELVAFEEKLLPSISKAMSSAASTFEQLSGQAKRLSDNKNDIDRILKGMPELIATASREIPALTKRFAAVLEESQSLSTVASAIRKSAVQLKAVEAGLPGVKASLAGSLQVARVARTKLHEITKDPRAYEQAAARTGQLLDSAAMSMQTFSEQLASRLGDETRILQAMAANCEVAQGAIPRVRSRLRTVCVALQLALALGAVIAFVSGGSDLRYRVVPFAAP